MNPFAEQEAWEDHQIRNGILHKITFKQTHHVLLSYFLIFLDVLIFFTHHFAEKATLKYGSKNKKQSSDDYQ